MEILWGKHENKPENATELNPKNLASCKGDVLIIHPGGIYKGNIIRAPEGKKMVESWPEKNFVGTNYKVWSNPKIASVVGILAGFDYELNYHLAHMGMTGEVDVIDATANIAVINGPNFNLLGEYRKDVYGEQTLEQIFLGMKAIAPKCNFIFRQTNNEGEFVGLIQQLRHESDAMIINAGAYAYTSVAIADALDCFHDQIIELHIDNPHQREIYRRRSFITPHADSYIAGFGPQGFNMALTAALMRL